jgi:hypothetical protein
MDDFIAFAIADGQICFFDTAQQSLSEYPIIRELEAEAIPHWRTSGKLASSFDEWLNSLFEAVIKRHEIPIYWQHTPLIK